MEIDHRSRDLMDALAWGLTRDAVRNRVRNEVGDIPVDVWGCPCGCNHAVAYARDLRGLWVVPTWVIPIAGRAFQKKVSVRVIESESEIDAKLWITCPEPFPEFMMMWMGIGLKEALVQAFRGTPHDNGLQMIPCAVCGRGRLVQLAMTSAFRTSECGFLHSVPRCDGFERAMSVSAEMLD